MSDDHSSLLFLIAGSVVFFFVLRYILFNYVFRPFILTQGVYPEKSVNKISESGFKICVYLPLWIWSFSMVWNEGWLQNPRECFRGMPNQQNPMSIYYLYSVQLGLYIYMQITHVLWDVKKKDFLAMLIHHFVTILLLCFSWWTGYMRTGVMILSAMDIVDVLLELAKFFNNLKIDLFANIFFVLLVFGWLGFRLILFPFVIIRSAMFDPVDVHHEDGYFTYDLRLWYVLNGLLSVLAVLQLYWFVMFIQVVVGLVVTGKVKDVTDKDQMKAKNDDPISNKKAD
jgi:ceramide synthetase